MRFGAHEDVERGAVVREARVATAGRPLEIDARHAQTAPLREHAEDLRRETEIARELAEQIEAKRLAREHVLEEPRPRIELPLRARHAPIGERDLTADDRPHVLGLEIREPLFGVRHREPRAERLPTMQPDRPTEFFAPTRLEETRMRPERWVARDEDVLALELVTVQRREIDHAASCVTMGRMSDAERDEQRERLSKIIAQAHEVRRELGALLASGKNVHFRPGSKGFSMVGLLHDKPQLGVSGLTDTKHTVAHFDELFKEHCDGDGPIRKTPEKSLQSFLTRDAYAHGRHMDAIEEASKRTNDPVELLFITDEIRLPHESANIVCDVLALRVDHGVETPVLLELKSGRELERLVGQVETYATLVDAHEDLFADLFAATLGREVRFDGPTERWIVWPAAGWDRTKPYDASKLDTKDRHEDELRDGVERHGQRIGENIRVVSYMENEGRYAFRVGER